MVLRSDEVKGLNSSSAIDSRLPSIFFNTAIAQAGPHAWRDFVECLFDFPTDVSASDFQANLTIRHFGSFLLCRSVVDLGRHVRDARRLAWDDQDHVVVSCIIGGSIALPFSDGRRLRAGDVAVLDLLSPARFSMAATEALHVIIPRVILPAFVAPLSPAPFRHFASGSAMAIFIRGVVESLWDASQYLDVMEVSAFGGAIIEMLSWCLGSATPLRPFDKRVDRGRRLRRHIEQNLHRSDLGPGTLLREVGLSRSQLFRQFKTSGGVETYIRQRRLRRARIALMDPRLADRRIGDIAFDTGFTDEAHFSRLFRQAFGQSPREARRAKSSGPDVSQGHLRHVINDAGYFARWLSTLGTS